MNGFTKLVLLISVLVLAIGGGFSFYLTYQSSQATPFTHANDRGIAIGGFDVIAYHTAGHAQKGKDNFQVTWAGTTWYFANLGNRQTFARDPERYAPAYGGYDPLGMATNGLMQPSNPELWEISDGRLYLFYTGQTHELWQKNKQDNLKNANIQWNRIKQQIRYKAKMVKKSES